MALSINELIKEKELLLFEIEKLKKNEHERAMRMFEASGEYMSLEYENNSLKKENDNLKNENIEHYKRLANFISKMGDLQIKLNNIKNDISQIDEYVNFIKITY
ncbi:MAG: hypothetical protein K0S67_19 [Nitrososphaeraceae archaeon]|jgi:FtsZ-binding cell division protein ZapB|nr:hypothetical protein [Nitrososphaeraceae archaeon]